MEKITDRSAEPPYEDVRCIFDESVESSGISKVDAEVCTVDHEKVGATCGHQVSTNFDSSEENTACVATESCTCFVQDGGPDKTVNCAGRPLEAELTPSTLGGHDSSSPAKGCNSQEAVKPALSKSVNTEGASLIVIYPTSKIHKD